MKNPPDDYVIIHFEGTFEGWLDRIRILCGKKIRVYIEQPVWVKYLENGKPCIGVTTVQPEVSVEPFRKPKPQYAVANEIQQSK